MIYISYIPVSSERLTKLRQVNYLLMSKLQRVQDNSCIINLHFVHIGESISEIGTCMENWRCNYFCSRFSFIPLFSPCFVDTPRYPGLTRFLLNQGSFFLTHLLKLSQSKKTGNQNKRITLKLSSWLKKIARHNDPFFSQPFQVFDTSSFQVLFVVFIL